MNILPGQLSFFEETTAPSTSVVGLRVVFQGECRKCEGRETVIGSSKGPHHAVLNCSACGEFRGWMYGESHQFISTIIDHWGRPSAPIVVRSIHKRK